MRLSLRRIFLAFILFISYGNCRVVDFWDSNFGKPKSKTEFPTSIVSLSSESGKDDATQRPNVVFVVIDSLRADVIGRYGVTPNLEKLQKSAFTFENHLVNASWTRPSTLIFFTGQYASRSSVNLWDYATPKEEAEGFQRSKIPKLPEILSNNGYYSIMIGNNPFVTNKNGLGVNCGFETVQDFSNLSNDTPKITQATIRFLDDFSVQKSGKPFFLFLNYNDPHKPYTPPANHLARVKTEEDLVELKRNYLGEVSYVDEELEKVFEKLKNLGVWENTILLVTADHGEVMNPKHATSLFTGTDTYFGHGSDLLLENIHVPFLLKIPNQMQGRKFTARTQSVDIFPTLIHLTGSKYEQSSSLDGWDLSGFWESNTKSQDWSKRPYYGETRFTQGIGIGSDWLLQKSYRFHKKGSFWESLVVGKEPLFYYNADKDPNQESPVKVMEPTQISLLPEPLLQEKIFFLHSNLRKLEPPISEYFVNFSKSVAEKTSKDEMVSLQINIDAGELRLLSGEPVLTRQTAKQWIVDGAKSNNFSFQVYPDTVFPKVQILRNGARLPTSLWGVGTFGINPEYCNQNCEALWNGSGADSNKNSSLLIQIWRRGEELRLSKGKSEYTPEALDILKKQGYVQ